MGWSLDNQRAWFSDDIGWAGGEGKRREEKRLLFTIKYIHSFFFFFFSLLFFLKQTMESVWERNDGGHKGVEQLGDYKMKEKNRKDSCRCRL